jgi:hypothetical protein
MAPAVEKLTLLALAIAAVGCRRNPLPVAPVIPDGGTRPLTTLRLLWRLPGLEAAQSLLTANPVSSTFLAVKQTGEHRWELCGIDVARGSLARGGGSTPMCLALRPS